MRERNETRDPARRLATRNKAADFNRRVAPVPALRSARPGHERHRRARANRWPSFIFTMSNSAVLFVPAARCCARVCPSLRMCLRFRVRRRAHGGFGASGRRDSSNSVPPMRGGWSADRRTLSSVAPATRDHPVPGRPGPLSALHRGGFRMRIHAAGSRQWNRSRSDCPRQAINAWRSGSGPPALRFAPQRGTPLLAPSCRIVSRKRPSEPGCESLYYKLDT